MRGMAQHNLALFRWKSCQIPIYTDPDPQEYSIDIIYIIIYLIVYILYLDSFFQT